MPSSPAALGPIVNSFAGGTLDRAAIHRKDPDWIRARFATGARLLPYWRGKHLVTGPREAPVAGWIDPAAGWWRQHAAAEPIFLGVDGAAAWFTVDLSAIEEPKAHPELAALGAFVDLRTLSPVLDAATGSLFAYARGLMLWHERHRFCGVCGSGTVVAEGGHVRHCVNPACAAHHFPRTDPVVIMLITDGDRCILGRQPKFPPGFYSCLAGFVEPAESLEEAVARESMEEAGVTVADVRYHSSQPWPFPASLMLGFTARATSFELTPQPEEMEDVAWFDRAWIRANAGTDAFRLPPRDAIARRLLDDWLAG